MIKVKKINAKIILKIDEIIDFIIELTLINKHYTWVLRLFVLKVLLIN